MGFQTCALPIYGQSVSAPIVMNAKGSNASSTLSGISGAAITITDNSKQTQLTGLDGATTVATLNRNVTTGKNTSGAIGNNLNVTEIQTGFAVTSAFIQQAGTFVANQA